MKKAIIVVLILALVAGISIGGTMAWLQDDDSAKNTMVVGNVSIEQKEYRRAIDENGNFIMGVEGTDFTANYGITRSYKLEEFVQGVPAYPAVYTNANKTQAYEEFQQLWNGVGAPGSNEIFDDSMKNVVDKFVFVENTGSSDCYYRTLVAIEAPEGTDKKMHLNFTTNNRFEINKVGYFELDGVRYILYCFNYKEVLTHGEVSRPSFLQAFLNPTTTNEDCAKLGSTWDILVISQAVQTAGFADATTALNAAFGEVTVDNAPELFDEIASYVYSGGEIQDIINNGGDNITLGGDIDLSDPNNPLAGLLG